MSDISRNFSRSEFACKCGCGYDTVDVELIMVVQDLREYYGRPVTINSGCRCEKHNKAEGGEPDSTHLIAKAGDIKVKGISSNKIYAYLDMKYPDKYGIGKYKGRTHIDVRPDRARWGVA